MKVKRPGVLRSLQIFLLLLLMSGNAVAQTKKNEIIYAGSSSREGKGIYVFGFDRKLGTLTELQTLNEGANPNFMAFSVDRKFLYVVYSKGTLNDGNGAVMSFTINPKNGFLTKLNEQSATGKGPAHISMDPKGRYVYVSNYGEGSLAVYPIGKDGSLDKASDVIKHSGSSIVVGRQEGPHAHSAIPSADGRFLYVSDLGVDKIFIYKVNDGGKLAPAEVPFYSNTPGSGPRHFAIHPNGKFAYSAEEISSTLASFKVDKATGNLLPIERLRMIPEDFAGVNSAADLHFSPDGKFLYASNRGHETLGIYTVNPNDGKLLLVGYEATGGKHPRNFMVDKKGEYVLVGNQNTNNIVVFKRDKQSGLLSRIGQDVMVPGAVFLIQF